MKIEFYEDHREKRPVEEFIETLTDRIELNQVVVYMRELQLRGYRLQRPFAAYLRDGIYELRPGQNRILYGWNEGGIVLLHALRKKTNKVPDQDIDLALKRLFIWRHR